MFPAVSVTTNDSGDMSATIDTPVTAPVNNRVAANESDDTVSFAAIGTPSAVKDFTSSERLKTLPAGTQHVISDQLRGLDRALQQMAFTHEIDSTGVKTGTHILNLRRKELDSAVNNLRRLRTTLAAIENQKLLLDNLHRLKLTLQTQFPDQEDSVCYYPYQTFPERGFTLDVMKEFRKTVIAARLEIVSLASPILVNKDSHKKVKPVKLLSDTCSALFNFYINPLDEKNVARLAKTAERIHREVGSYWRPIAQAVGVVIATACLVVALLGLIPSFGASSGLAGFAFFIALGVASSLRVPLGKSMKTANHLHAHLQDIGELGKRLAFFKRKPVELGVIGQVAEQKVFSLRRSASDSKLFSASKMPEQASSPGLLETTSARTRDNQENQSIRAYFPR